MKTNWPALGFSCLLLAGAAVAVPPASAQVAQQTPVSAAAPLASISAVEIAQPGQQTTVRISGTGELHYQTSRLDSPPRLVLDFADTRLNVEKYKVPSEYAPVLDVRMGQPESRAVSNRDRSCEDRFRSARKPTVRMSRFSSPPRRLWQLPRRFIRSKKPAPAQAGGGQCAEYAASQLG